MVVHTETESLELCARNKTRDRLRHETAEGLVKARDLGRFEAQALIEINAAERARVNAAHVSIAPRGVNEPNLRRELVFGVFAIGDRYCVVVQRVFEAVIADARCQLELLPGLPL